MARYSSVMIAHSIRLAALLTLMAAGRLNAQPAANAAAAEVVKAKYEKREVRIVMRDGVKLFTSIYIPRDTTRRYPILMTRTPYGVGPYGADAYRASLGPSERYANEGMIFVYQDARGRNFSEGVFTEMTPHKDRKGPKDVDESTDSYDTIDWLVKNVAHNNGNVGIVGGSYPGFYTTASCIDAHPALKACSPQAPMTDIYMGDDVFHNGAFLLPHNWTFYSSFGRAPRTEPGPDKRYPFSMGTQDAYKYYLELGPLGPASAKVYAPAGSAPAWDSVLAHPNYDQYWKSRDIRPHLKKMAPAVLTVGGFYDTEDLAGPWMTYAAAETLSPASDNKLVVGPWSHGGWGRGDGTSLGTLRWNTKTAPFFRDSVEFPFFMHWLAGAPTPNLPEALVFRTGADHWDHYDSWPPKNVEHKSLYLGAGGTLGFQPPRIGNRKSGIDPSFSSYVSDPNKPVPLVDRIESQGMPRDYITADQRFASRRPDVAVFQTEPLAEDVTIAGPVNPVLFVATSGTDADFVVKLIDVFPDDAPNWPGDSSGFKVGGYQQLVRGEPFRGKFRKSFSNPVAFQPNVPDSIRFSMPDVNHTFRKGHRIMVQVQSSWFPHIDRNPQTFVPNIFLAKPSDFQTATMRVYHMTGKRTRLEVGVVPSPKM
ncbi:MAG TPA: CocE/NonD family hydrolase [Gemmatimonadaceae bacterium]|nr:CocE/NonD family hydrolase [Gemmatimonadaceae bacterium]